MSEAANPFHYLLDLAARARAANALLPTGDAEANQNWNGVGFRLGGHFCVAPIDDIAEVLVEPAVTRLPGVKHWIKGVANVRGRLLPLMDLAAFFDVDGDLGRGDRRVLVVERGEIYIGMIVDEVFGLQHFAADQFSADSGDIDTGIGRFVHGRYSDDSRSWALFRPLHVLEDQEFFNVAA